MIRPQTARVRVDLDDLASEDLDLPAEVQADLAGSTTRGPAGLPDLDDLANSGLDLRSEIGPDHADQASQDPGRLADQAQTWREVQGFEGLYDVSDLGNVRSWSTAKQGGLLSPRSTGRYLGVTLHGVGKRRTALVHALVAEAFIGPRPNGKMVRHLNGDPLDSRAVNLAYVTNAQNQRGSVQLGNHVNARKTHCPAGHPYSGRNLIRGTKGKGRYCRACRKARAPGYR